MANYRRPPRTVLEHVLRDRGWSFETAARQFADQARASNIDASMSSRHLARLAAGNTETVRNGTAKVLGDLFERPVSDLLRPWSPETAVVAQSPTSADHDRQEDLMTMTARRARDFALQAGQAMTGDAIEQLHADVEKIARSYQQRPLTEILSELVATQDALFSLLDYRHRPAESRQLHLLAGVVGGVLAKAAHDMADRHSAMTHARTAYLLAEHAESDGLKAWIRGLQSFISFWANRPTDAIRYAEQGTALSTNSAQVFIAANEARAWAALGNETKALEAIAAGERAAAEVTPDDIDAFGGICSFGRARQLYYAADALTVLPEPGAGAADYAQQALDAYADPSAPDWSFSDEAGSASALAIARINDGEISGAADVLRPVLELEPSQRINGIVSSLDRVHRSLSSAADSPTVTELRSEIEAFTRAPLVSLASFST